MSQSKTPTAKEFISKYCVDEEGKPLTNVGIYYPLFEEALIDFGKLHAKNALEAANNNATCSNKAKFSGDVNYQVDMDSILNDYPLDNIK